MDLRAIINHDPGAPPHPQASPPPPAPASIPASVPFPMQGPPPAQRPAPQVAALPVPPASRKRKRGSAEKPIWAYTWSEDWRSKPWAESVPPPIRQSPVLQRPPSSQRVNGTRRNTQSPGNMPGVGSIPERFPKSWEANIVDRVPLDQMSRIVADFLFGHVISAPELGPGAVFEIEAKLGHLINQNTNERLHIPVLNDCIVDKNDPSMRVAFKSSMTELQHRAFNEFLNGALMQSLPPKAPSTPAPPSRIPLSYKHTRQSDVFYELTPEASSRLPPSVLPMLNNRQSKARVRITTDQKTQQELAKIIKIRVADLDVHSPQTLFDWRISINIEINYHGPIQELVRVVERGQQTPPRNKDRMTYNHLAYQIDLTQVTSPADQSKEHELEVEIKAMDELKRQGTLAQAGQENNYEQIVRGFVDNVRLLQRQLRIDHA